MSYIGNTQQNQNYFPAVDFFSGNGSTTAFTLSRPVYSTAAIQVIVSNVSQNPSDAYTVNGNTITFTSAPPSGTNNIYVYYTSPNTTVVQPGQGTVGTTQLADAAVTTAKLSSTTGTGAVALASLPSFTTTIGVGGATASASGSGISFPATQSASSNANTLDDYEEGTWTLNIAPGSGSFTQFNQTGYYVKIGRVVYINVWWRKTAESTPGGSITLSGFPFAFSTDATNVARQRLWTTGYAFVGLSNRSWMWTIPDAGATTANMLTSWTDYVGGSTITASNFTGANTEVYINGFYMVD